MTRKRHGLSLPLWVAVLVPILFGWGLSIWFADGVTEEVVPGSENPQTAIKETSKLKSLEFRYIEDYSWSNVRVWPSLECREIERTAEGWKAVRSVGAPLQGTHVSRDLQIVGSAISPEGAATTIYWDRKTAYSVSLFETASQRINGDAIYPSWSRDNLDLGHNLLDVAVNDSEVVCCLLGADSRNVEAIVLITKESTVVLEIAEADLQRGVPENEGTFELNCDAETGDFLIVELCSYKVQNCENVWVHRLSRAECYSSLVFDADLTRRVRECEPGMIRGFYSNISAFLRAYHSAEGRETLFSEDGWDVILLAEDRQRQSLLVGQVKSSIRKPGSTEMMGIVHGPPEAQGYGNRVIILTLGGEEESLPSTGSVVDFIWSGDGMLR